MLIAFLGICCSAAATLGIAGELSVANSKYIGIAWEWPAGRNLESKILVYVREVSLAPTGLLGVQASPSLAGSLPQATNIVAYVATGPKDLQGQIISMRVPGEVAKGLLVGDKAAIALINGNKVGICLAATALTDSQAIGAWFEGWKCKS
jgi:hypothetical protein